MVCTEYLGYDSYSEFVCTAENKEKARTTYPSGDGYIYCYDTKSWLNPDGSKLIEEWAADMDIREWTADLDEITVKKVGTAKSDKPEVIVASYHAG